MVTTLAGCASSSPPSALRTPQAVRVGATSGRVDGLDLSKLGSLTNYAAEVVVGSAAPTVYRVHSPTDWEELTATGEPLSVDVGNAQYTPLPPAAGTAGPRWAREVPAAAYQRTPYPSDAVGFADLTQVPGVRLVRGAPCTDAGTAGHRWGFEATRAGAAYPHVSACIADGSGALLSYIDQATTPTGTSVGTAAPRPLATLTVTAIGTVPPIPAPGT